MKNLLICIFSGILVSCAGTDSTVNYTVITEKEVQIETDNSIVIIEVKLDKEINENELKKVALEIKKERPGKEYFWISYYLKSEKEENKIWAISNFIPELTIEIYKEIKDGSNEIEIIESNISNDNDSHKTDTEEEKFDSLLIIPGKSLGDIKLGMTKEEVNDIMTFPDDFTKEIWSFDTENYEKLLRIYFKDNTVYQICFTYPEFTAIEGFSLENHRNNPEHFTVYEYDREETAFSGKKLIDLMYVLNSGGLVFIDFDIHDADPQQRDLLYWGIIFKGNLPPDENTYDWKKQGEDIEPIEDEYNG